MLAVDYIIFALMLVISAAIGIYFRFTGGKQKTNDEYLLGDRKMSIIPVAFSLMASFLSASAVIGLPAETYMFGLNMPYFNIAGIVGVILSSYLLLPVFWELKVTTIYEYLEKRFGKLTRTCMSLAFVVQMILYMSVALYAPALALSAVTNLTTWTSVISTGVVCTFYCMMGGIKAVLWTDVFQALLMFLCIFTVLFKGLVDFGGPGNIYRISLAGGRLEVPGFEFDPEVRYTMWNIFLQALTLSISLFGGNQVQVQRMLTVKTINQARLSIIGCIIIAVPFHVLNCMLGLVLYAYYVDCDPLSSPEKIITSADQLIPYHIMTTLSTYPGLTGACVCGIFSATLSTLSSAVNSLTAVTMEDFIRPFFLSKGISETNMTHTSKGITIFYGLLTIALTFLVATFGNLVQASITIFGMVGGPSLAIFLLGMFTKRSNEKGVLIGFVISLSLALWASFGASAYGPPPKMLPMSAEGCLINSTISSTSDMQYTPSYFIPNDTSTDFTSTPLLDESHEDIFPLYRISYLWFAQIGFVSAIIIGYIASILVTLITGKDQDVSDEYLSPVFRWIFRDSNKNDANTMTSLELNPLKR